MIILSQVHTKRIRGTMVPAQTMYIRINTVIDIPNWVPISGLPNVPQYRSAQLMYNIFKSHIYFFPVIST